MIKVAEFYKTTAARPALHHLNQYLKENEQEIDLIEIQKHSDCYVLIYNQKTHKIHFIDKQLSDIEYNLLLSLEDTLRYRVEVAKETKDLSKRAINAINISFGYKKEINNLHRLVNAIKKDEFVKYRNISRKTHNEVTLWLKNIAKSYMNNV